MKVTICHECDIHVTFYIYKLLISHLNENNYLYNITFSYI